MWSESQRQVNALGGEGNCSRRVARLSRLDARKQSPPHSCPPFSSEMDAWDAGFNRANNAVQDIQELISERDRLRRAGASGSDAGSKVRLALSNLDRNLSTLDSTLVKLEASPPPAT